MNKAANIVFKRFDKIQEELVLSSQQEVSDFLTDNGFNADEVYQEGDTFIKRLRTKAKAKSEKESLTDLYLLALKKIKDTYKSKSEYSKQILENALMSKSSSFQFRNLEKMDVSDLKELLNETEIIEIIEKLKEDDLKGE